MMKRKPYDGYYVGKVWVHPDEGTINWERRFMVAVSNPRKYPREVADMYLCMVSFAFFLIGGILVFLNG